MIAYMAVLKITLLNTNTDATIYEEVRAVIGDRLVDCISAPYSLNAAAAPDEYCIGVAGNEMDAEMNPVDLLVIATRELVRKRRDMFPDMVVSVVESRIYPLNADLIVITKDFD